MAKMAASMVETGEDAFRKMFKRYRTKHPPPDFSDVLDFSTGKQSDKIIPVKLDKAAVSDVEVTRVGLQPVRNWRAFSLLEYPGFVFISNPFQPGCQAFWVRQCLKTYPQKPNVCNLDMHMSPSETQNIWEKSVPVLKTSPAVKRQAKTLVERLRWVTLGYHYNWDTKAYSADHHTPFPPELHLLSRHIAAACGFPKFSPEAGILNYYHSDSSLGIHVDESELDHSHPLLSLSFGQSAIFLLGGLCRQDPPTAMYMRSGDVMVMSGQSRLRYHAVPRILVAPRGQTPVEVEGCGPTAALQASSVVEPLSQEDWAVCCRYIQSSRVNVTLRQVLGPGQNFPDTTFPTPKTPGGQEGENHDRASGRDKRKRSSVETAETDLPH